MDARPQAGPTIGSADATGSPSNELLGGARMVGVYKILNLLGAGGMGIVWRAYDTSLDRDVALKMLQTTGHPDPAELERFRREAETLARLKHPDIVQIYAIGEQEGEPYLVMELIPGGSLDRRLNGKP